jgi:AraC-like DNA-binding protein
MDNMDLFFDDSVKDLISSFSCCFKVRITIRTPHYRQHVRDLENSRIRSFGIGGSGGAYHKSCTYCRFIREKLRYEERCKQLDREMCSRAENSPGPLSYTCHGGLVDAVVPIRMRGDLIGYGMIGQFRTKNTIPAAILREWQETGMEQDILKKAFLEQPYIEKDMMENMLNLFSMLCAFIVSSNYIRFRRLDMAEQVAHWVEDHIAEPVLLSQAAEHLGYSRSAISHTIKQRLNISFKQLCILKKIEHFETIITETPGLSIEKAAFQAGYSDASYFSRLYKKVRGSFPSAFVKTARSFCPVVHVVTANPDKSTGLPSLLPPSAPSFLAQPVNTRAIAKIATAKA